MIQQMLAIWSLVLLPFLNPAWTSGSSWFHELRVLKYWSLAWRIPLYIKYLPGCVIARVTKLRAKSHERLERTSKFSNVKLLVSKNSNVYLTINWNTWFLKIWGFCAINLETNIYSCMCVCAQLYLSLCVPMDCGPPGYSVHVILQVRILKWVAVPSSRGSSSPRDQTSLASPALAARFFTTSTTWEAQVYFSSPTSPLTGSWDTKFMLWQQLP